MIHTLTHPIVHSIVHPVIGYRIPFARKPLTDIILALFANNEQGAYYDPYDLTDEKLAWRRNLLLWSEDFSNASWGKIRSTTANSSTYQSISGTNPAIDITQASGETAGGGVIFIHDFDSTVLVTGYASVRARTKNFLRLGFSGDNAKFDLVNGTVGFVSPSLTATIVDEGDGWFGCYITQTALLTGSHPFSIYNADNLINTITVTDDGGITVRAAQLENGSVATDYQKITNFNTDFMAQFPNHTLFQDSLGTIPVTGHSQPVGLVLDKSGRNNHASQSLSAARPLWENNGGLKSFYFDGFDDHLVTVNPMDLSGTSEVSLFAGVRREGDKSISALCEFTDNSTTSSGSFGIFAPLTERTYQFRQKGSGSTVYNDYYEGISELGSGYPHSIFSNFTLLVDGQFTARVNNEIRNAIPNPDGGSFSNSLLYIGAREGSSFFFQGHIYGLVIRSTLTPDAQSDKIQQLLATRSGVTL